LPLAKQSATFRVSANRPPGLNARSGLHAGEFTLSKQNKRSGSLGQQRISTPLKLTLPHNSPPHSAAPLLTAHSSRVPRFAFSETKRRLLPYFARLRVKIHAVSQFPLYLTGFAGKNSFCRRGSQPRRARLNSI